MALAVPSPVMAEISVHSADGTRRLVPLAKDRTSIGRSRESDIFLPDQWLSRHHAEIRARDGSHVLVDLGSKNGTLLNGEAVKEERRLRPGDVITLGEHRLTYSPAAAAEEEEAAPEGTRVFSVQDLSAVATRPAADPTALARQNRVLRVLMEAGKALLEHRPLPEVFEQVLDLLFEAVPAERGAILLLEGEPALPVVKASRARHGTPITHVSRSIARKVMDELSGVILPNLMEDSAFRGQESILASGIRSALCAPLWLSGAGKGKDQVIGLVYLDSLQRSHSFTQEDLEILSALANVAAAKIENARLVEESLEKRRLEEDMRVAAEIQRGLLPSCAPKVGGWGLVGSNRPCRAVGGDYFDLMEQKDSLLLALGDVSGKGTGAALLMAVLRAAVRAHWTGDDAAESVSRINRTVCQNVPPGKYVTFFLGRLVPATGRLVYVNAGHNPPLLVRADGAVEWLGAGGMVLGLLEDAPYEQGEVELDRGDALLVFSDGVTETWSAADEEFGEQRLADLVVRNRHLGAEALEAEVLKELELFAAGTKSTDDRTLIVLKRDAAEVPAAVA